jgi:hypothetical protein
MTASRQALAPSRRPIRASFPMTSSFSQILSPAQHGGWPGEQESPDRCDSSSLSGPLLSGSHGRVALLFGHPAPDPVHLPGPDREVQAFAADQAAGADRLGLGYLELVAGGGRDREEQAGVSSGGGRCSVLLAALGSCHARPRVRKWMGSLANLGIAPVAWPTEEVS